MVVPPALGTGSLSPVTTCRGWIRICGCLQTAAAGFGGARQFLVVEHVAHDLNISFAQLKAEVTGANPVSLKEAVSGLRTDLSAATIRTDLAVARQETKVDLQAAGVFVEEQREIARE